MGGRGEEGWDRLFFQSTEPRVVSAHQFWKHHCQGRRNTGKCTLEPPQCVPSRSLACNECEARPSARRTRPHKSAYKNTCGRAKTAKARQLPGEHSGGARRGGAKRPGDIANSVLSNRGGCQASIRVASLDRRVARTAARLSSRCLGQVWGAPRVARSSSRIYHRPHPGRPGVDRPSSGWLGPNLA